MNGNKRRGTVLTVLTYLTHQLVAETIQRQPEGLQDSSRGLSAQARAIPPEPVKISMTLKGSKKLNLAPLQGANSSTNRSGGLRFASTPGYYLATLRVASAFDSSSMLLPLLRPGKTNEVSASRSDV